MLQVICLAAVCQQDVRCSHEHGRGSPSIAMGRPSVCAQVAALPGGSVVTALAVGLQHALVATQDGTVLRFRCGGNGQPCTSATWLTANHAQLQLLPLPSLHTLNKCAVCPRLVWASHTSCTKSPGST